MRAKLKMICFAMLLCAAVTVPAGEAKAQLIIIDIIKAAAKKVIRQIDLRVQQLQNKTIALQNAQKTLENAMSKAKLKEISEWMEKQRKLYDEYYQELKKVKAAIGTYQAVRDIIDQQAQIVGEYQMAYGAFRKDPNFSEQELAYMYKVYTGMLNESAANLDRLLLVTSSFQTQMTDGKRLELIAGIAAAMSRNLSDLRRFNSQGRLLSIQRSRDRKDIRNTGSLYGLPQKDGL